MKVCFFIANLGDGGAQRQCVALLNELQHDPAVELHLILLGPGEHEKSLDRSRLTVHRTEVQNFGSPKALLFAIQTLRRVRPDVLISWLHPADIWSFAATRVVRGVPWIMTERGSASAYPDEINYNLRKIFGRRGAAAIIANSPLGKQLWDSLTPRAPVQVIPNMVLEDEIPVSVDRSASVDCLYVGRLEPQKNVGAMTSAFSRFAAKQPDARLIVVGKGALAGDIERIAKDGSVASQVELVGFRDDVPRMMSRARLLLSFSKHEGMPNVVMEAVAAGLPAVVSDIPEHRALLGDDYPYYVRLDFSAEVAASIVAEAWRSGVERSDEAFAHARQILATMTPDNVAAAYLDSFAGVITRSGQPSIKSRKTRWGLPSR